MGINNSQNAQFATELSAAMNGSTVLIGTLTSCPTHIVFTNLGSVNIQIFVNQTTNIWKTFPGGNSVTLDLKAAAGVAGNYTFPVGTTFFGNGASGTFSIAYIYPQTQ